MTEQPKPPTPTTPPTFQTPSGLNKPTGTTVAKVTHAELVDSKFGGKQMKFEWITKRQNRIITYLTLTAAAAITKYLSVGVLYYTDDSHQMLAVTPYDEQPFVWIDLKDGKITDIRANEEKQL